MHPELYKVDGKTQPDRINDHVVKKPLEKKVVSQLPK